MLFRAAKSFSAPCRDPFSLPLPSAAFSFSGLSGGSCHGCPWRSFRAGYVHHHFPSCPPWPGASGSS